MIRVAVVGSGHWGPNLTRNFADAADSCVAWVVDRDPARLAQVAARLPEVRTSTELDPVLDDPEVDAVVVATPTATHHELCRRALLAGKHVLVEKPLASSVDEATDLVALAEAGGRILMVGHVFLFNSAVRYVQRYLEDGDLGRIYYLSMVRTNLGPIRGDVNAAWDLASHDISIANYWLGSAPESVSAVGRPWINDGVEDAVFATLRYPDNVLVNLHASWLNPRKARDITVVGEHRMITVDDMNLLEPVRIYDKGVRSEPAAGYVDTFASFRASVREGDITIPKVATGEPLRAECEHFIECVGLGKLPFVGGAEGLAVVQVLDAIDRSLRAGGSEQSVGR